MLLTRRSWKVVKPGLCETRLGVISLRRGMRTGLVFSPALPSRRARSKATSRPPLGAALLVWPLVWPVRRSPVRPVLRPALWPLAPTPWLALP